MLVEMENSGFAALLKYDTKIGLRNVYNLIYRVLTESIISGMP